MDIGGTKQSEHSAVVSSHGGHTLDLDLSSGMPFPHLPPVRAPYLFSRMLSHSSPPNPHLSTFNPYQLAPLIPSSSPNMYLTFFFITNFIRPCIIIRSRTKVQTHDLWIMNRTFSSLCASWILGEMVVIALKQSVLQWIYKWRKSKLCRSSQWSNDKLAPCRS